MPAVSLLWNTNVAVMTCENNFPLRVGVAACGGSHSEGWQGYALLSAASLDSTSLMGTSPCAITQVVKSSWLPAKIAAYLVSIGWQLCLAFLYRWAFLNKISLN